MEREIPPADWSVVAALSDTSTAKRRSITSIAHELRAYTHTGSFGASAPKEGVTAPIVAVATARRKRSRNISGHAIERRFRGRSDGSN